MNNALRYNEGKPQWSLVDFDSIEPLVRVLEYGCIKYERDNWKKGLNKDQILDYHRRKGMSLDEIEKWLRPVLNYDEGD